MATIIKAEDVFRPLTDEQKCVVRERMKYLDKYKGKFQYTDYIFNLGI